MIDPANTQRNKPNGNSRTGENSPSIAAAATNPPETPNPPIAVSIVDDDAVTQGIVARWIRRSPGFRIVGAHGSAERALALVPAEKPEVVLMDINLPGLNGIECVRRLKAVLPGTQFVIFTVYGDSNHIFDALAAGATGYLLKEATQSDLIDSLRQVHRGGSPMTSEIARKVVQSFRAPAEDRLNQAFLTPREWDILRALARGLTFKEIAQDFQISVATVNTHVRHIYEKLHVGSRARAVAACLKSLREYEQSETASKRPALSRVQPR